MEKWEECKSHFHFLALIPRFTAKKNIKRNFCHTSDSKNFDPSVIVWKRFSPCFSGKGKGQLRWCYTVTYSLYVIPLLSISSSKWLPYQCTRLWIYSFNRTTNSKTFSITVWYPFFFFHNIFRKGRGLALIKQKEAATGKQCAEGSRSTNRRNFQEYNYSKRSDSLQGKRDRETELAKLSSSSCWGSHATFKLFEDEIARFSPHCVERMKRRTLQSKKTLDGI